MTLTCPECRASVNLTVDTASLLTCQPCSHKFKGPVVMEMEKLGEQAEPVEPYEHLLTPAEMKQMEMEEEGQLALARLTEKMFRDVEDNICG